MPRKRVFSRKRENRLCDSTGGKEVNYHMNNKQLAAWENGSRLWLDREINYDICTGANGNRLHPISRSHVKRIALAYAKRTRAQGFQRISKSFLLAVESNALAFIKDRVNRHPSRGK